jgi:hypothetical protein
MALAYSHQRPSDFRLKRRDGDNQNADEETVEKVLKPFKMQCTDEQLQNQNADDEDEYDGAEQPFSASAFEKVDNPVDDQPYEDQFDGNVVPFMSCHSTEIIDQSGDHRSNPFVVFLRHKLCVLHQRTGTVTHAVLCPNELRYPFVGELAGLVGKEKRVNVGHQLLLIDSGDPLVPSAPFGGSLTGLLIGTAATGQANQGP